MLAFPMHMHFLKRNFCHKKSFLLVNLFTPSFNRSYQEADICDEKISQQSHSLKFERIFNFWQFENL